MLVVDRKARIVGVGSFPPPIIRSLLVTPESLENSAGMLKNLRHNDTAFFSMSETSRGDRLHAIVGDHDFSQRTVNWVDRVNRQILAASLPVNHSPYKLYNLARFGKVRSDRFGQSMYSLPRLRPVVGAEQKHVGSTGARG